MDEMDEAAPVRKPWGKWIGIFFTVLLLLAVVAYFVGTSSAFIKGVILPKAGASLNARITVGDISVSPFSQVYIKQLRVETTGPEPLLTADEALVRYSLMDILKGNIKVDELTLASPVINIVQEPDGSSNLDPLTKGEKKEQPKSSKEPAKVSIQNVSLKNGTIRQTEKLKGGAVTHTELQGLNIDLDHLGNGQMGHLKLAANFAREQRQGTTNSVLGGQLSGGYDLSLNQELMPDTVKGAMTLTVSRAEGAFKDLAGFNGSLDADLTPKEIRQVALRFARNNQSLGQIRISGPMDIDKKEGSLKLEVNSIDKNVLALATAGKNYDFGNSQVNATNQVTISQGGTFISANGNVAGSSMTLSQGAMRTPEMNLNLDYQVAVNTTDKSAVLQRINLSGAANGKEFLRTELDRQMNLSWGQNVKGYRDAALNLLVTNLNLAEWRAVLGTNVTAGIANIKVTLASQQDGRLLNTILGARIDGLSAQAGTNHLDNASLTFDATGTLEQLNVVNLPRYSLALRQNDAPVLQASGSARYVLDTKDTTAQVALEGALPRLLALASVPDANAAGGALKASASFTGNGTKRSAVGNAALADFTGAYQKYSFTNFTLGLDYNVDLSGNELTLNRTALAFTQGFNRGGTVELKGKYNLESKAGQFNFNTVDLNQNAFGSVLAPSLGDNQLVSISLNASGDARLDPIGGSSINADVKVANWLVQDTAGKLPKTPLAVEMKIDGGMKEQAVELRQFLVQLSPTPRAKNALQMQAKLDLAKTNPAPSTITLTSESFDLTPYYDMFAGKPGANAVAEKKAPSPVTGSGTGLGQGAPGEQKEPAPMQLPIQQLTADLKIDRLFLREVAISNWVGKVVIRSNVIQLDPFQLQLNGAPLSVTGNVNVGSPGYIYNLALKADGVPLGPLANSFGSGTTNTLQGNLIAEGQIRGAGTTGPSLRRNLGGNLNLNVTNMNYQVVGPKLRRILVPISLALRVPELVETPINWVSAQTHIGDGTVNLQHLGVESEAFYAESAGTITLADILTNSTLDLPIDLSLRRSLAEKTGLIANDGNTNQTKYAKLTRFVSVKGTLGAPETDINKLAVAGMALKGAAAFGLGNARTESALGAVGGLLTGQTGGTNTNGTNASGNLVQTLGGLFGGKTAPPNGAAASTNAPRENIVRGLTGLLGGQPANPATNSVPSATNAVVTNAVQNALDSLFRSKPKKK